MAASRFVTGEYVKPKTLSSIYRVTGQVEMRDPQSPTIYTIAPIDGGRELMVFESDLEYPPMETYEPEPVEEADENSEAADLQARIQDRALQARMSVYAPGTNGKRRATLKSARIRLSVFIGHQGAALTPYQRDKLLEILNLIESGI